VRGLFRQQVERPGILTVSRREPCSPTVAAITTITAIAVTTTTTTTSTAAITAAAAAASPAAAAAAAATPAAAPTTAATGTTAAAAPAATTTAAAWLTLFSLVDADGSTFDHRAVQLRDRVLGFLGRTHGHEAEAA
jgi:hypothetical protein